jgi:K+-sensing histidine kinase KdpD
MTTPAIRETTGGLLRGRALAYGGALAAVLAASLLASSLQPVLEPSVVLLVTVAVVGWVGGWRPALLASLGASLALDYFFVAPVHTFRLDLTHLPRLAVFAITAAVFTSVSARRRAAEESLKHVSR